MIHHNSIARSVSLHCLSLKHDQRELHLTDTRGTGEAAAWLALWRAQSITLCYVWEQQGLYGYSMGSAGWAILVRLAGSSSWPTLNSPADWAEWAAWMIAWDLSIYHSLHLVPRRGGGGDEEKLIIPIWNCATVHCVQLIAYTHIELTMH